MKRFLVLTPLLILFAVGCDTRSVPVHPSNQGGGGGAASPSSNDAGTNSGAQIVIPDDAAVAVTSNYYFVIDGSGSMADAPPTRGQFSNKMDGAKWAVREAIKLVPDDAHIALFVFDGRSISERAPLGTSKDNFLRKVDEIRAGGGTPLAESIVYGVDALKAQRSKQLGFGEYRLIVVTDGEATGIPDAVGYAANNDIPVYGIGLGVNSSHPLRNGTIYSDASSITELKDALAETVGEMKSLDVSNLNF